MIEISLIGALGNQMFEYAFARSLSLEYGGEPIIVNRSYNTLTNRVRELLQSSVLLPEHCFKYVLSDFYADSNITFMNGGMGMFRAIVVASQHYALIKRYNHLNVVSDRKEIENIFKKSSKNGKYYLPVDDQKYYFWEPEKTSQKKKILSGTFQSEKYFYKYKEVIKKELTVKTPPSEPNRKMRDEIGSCNAVCVHLRCGFFTDSDATRRQRFVCGDIYYRNAMRYISKFTTNPIFYIFSDNIDYARSFIRFEYPVRYVDLHNPSFEEIRLMSKCKHFIMCNSSFSWWASYLSENNDKIVCVPSLWRRSDPNSTNSDVYRDDMIKIDIDNDCVF